MSFGLPSKSESYRYSTDFSSDNERCRYWNVGWVWVPRLKGKAIATRRIFHRLKKDFANQRGRI